MPRVVSIVWFNSPRERIWRGREREGALLEEGVVSQARGDRAGRGDTQG